MTPKALICIEHFCHPFFIFLPNGWCLVDNTCLWPSFRYFCRAWQRFFGALRFLTSCTTSSYQLHYVFLSVAVVHQGHTSLWNGLVVRTKALRCKRKYLRLSLYLGVKSGGLLVEAGRWPLIYFPESVVLMRSLFNMMDKDVTKSSIFVR